MPCLPYHDCLSSEMRVFLCVSWPRTDWQRGRKRRGAAGLGLISLAYDMSTSRPKVSLPTDGDALRGRLTWEINETIAAFTHSRFRWAPPLVSLMPSSTWDGSERVESERHPQGLNAPAVSPAFGRGREVSCPQSLLAGYHSSHHTCTGRVHKPCYAGPALGAERAKS